MNERKFLKEINSKDNEDGSLTCAKVFNLIDLQRKQLGLQTSKNYNVFRKIFSRFKKEKSAVQIINNNFSEILEKTNSYSVDILIVKLSKDLETKNIVEDNLNVILNRLIRDDTFKECNQEAFECIIETPKGKTFIEQEIDNILGNVSPSNMYKFSRYLKGLSNNVDERLNNALENNRTEVAKSLLEEVVRKRGYLEYNEDLINQYKSTLSIMINELLESEKCRYIDIKYLNSGSYSDVYQIGDKVIKIGGPRQTYSMPNHRRILQPLTRTNFIDEKNKNQSFACIEISDKIDLLSIEDYVEEKLYEIYKDLREDGIIWTDIKWTNVGKLSKKNIPSLNGEEMNVAPNSVGFTNDKDKRELSIGDLIIIDTDFIYTEGNDNIVCKNIYAREFERRYQQEKSVEIAEKYNSKDVDTGKEIKEEQR